MRFGLLGGAVLGVGIALGAPSFAKADHYRDFRGHDVRVRDVRRDVIVERPVIREDVIVPAPVLVTSDIDQPVALADVPACVTTTLAHEGYFGRVETVQFVRRGPEVFYRFRVAGPRGPLDLRISAGGGLLGISAAF